ncbi:nuclear transport factor 2 family protein [Shouchella sp. 1P09AA]|uniref:nuclear transport factor 2 family protein n=1 Tax=unclassified Shouchella TaxID=2893065 RepID=UPI0039A30B93
MKIGDEMHYEVGLKMYIEATNTHCFKEVRKRLHPNAVFYFTDKSCFSMEAIESYFETAWEQIKDEIYEAKDIQWQFVTEEVAACTYIFSYEGYRDDSFISGKGRATNLFVQHEHEWKLIHEHLSPMPSIEESYYDSRIIASH